MCTRKCEETVILVIEDDPCMGALLEEYLQEDRHYRVLLATNGKEALHLVQQIQPGLLIIDQRLPDIPGEEVYKQIHESLGFETVPVLMLSADISLEGARTHPLPFLRKPFTLGELDAFLDRLCPCT